MLNNFILLGNWLQEQEIALAEQENLENFLRSPLPIHDELTQVNQELERKKKECNANALEEKVPFSNDNNSFTTVAHYETWQHFITYCQKREQTTPASSVCLVLLEYLASNSFIDSLEKIERLFEYCSEQEKQATLKLINQTLFKELKEYIKEKLQNITADCSGFIIDVEDFWKKKNHSFSVISEYCRYLNYQFPRDIYELNAVIVRQIIEDNKDNENNQTVLLENFLQAIILTSPSTDDSNISEEAKEKIIVNEQVLVSILAMVDNPQVYKICIKLLTSAKDYSFAQCQELLKKHDASITLELAIKASNKELVFTYIQDSPERQRTAFLKATQYQQLDIIQELLEKYPILKEEAVELKNRFINEKNNYLVVKYLCSLTGYFDVDQEVLLALLEFSANNGLFKDVQIFLELWEVKFPETIQAAREQVLLKAAAGGRLRIVQFILPAALKGYNHDLDKLLGEAIEEASIQGSLPVIKYLSVFFSSSFSPSNDETRLKTMRESVLSYAISFNYIEIINYCNTLSSLENFNNPNIQKAFFRAASLGHIESIAYLDSIFKEPTEAREVLKVILLRAIKAGKPEVISYCCNKLEYYLSNDCEFYNSLQQAFLTAAKLGHVESITYFDSIFKEPTEAKKVLEVILKGAIETGKLEVISYCCVKFEFYLPDVSKLIDLAIEATKKDRLLIVKYLLNRVITNTSGNIPNDIYDIYDIQHDILQVACANNCLSIVKYFCTQKTELLTEDCIKNALHSAIYNKQLSIVKYLFSLESFSITKELFKEVLESAISSGHLPIVEYLFSLKSFPITEKLFKKALKSAIFLGNLPIIEYLFSLKSFSITEGFFKKALETAISCGHLSIVKYLFSSEDFLITPGFFKETLKSAISHGHLSIVKYLFSLEAFLITQGFFKEALESAISYGHLSIGEYLFSVQSSYIKEEETFKAVVLKTCFSLKSFEKFFFKAVTENHVELVKYLISLLLSSSLENTPLEVLLIKTPMYGNLEIVQAICSIPALTTSKNIQYLEKGAILVNKIDILLYLLSLDNVTSDLNTLCTMIATDGKKELLIRLLDQHKEAILSEDILVSMLTSAISNNQKDFTALLCELSSKVSFTKENSAFDSICNIIIKHIQNTNINLPDSIPFSDILALTKYICKFPPVKSTLILNLINLISDKTIQKSFLSDPDISSKLSGLEKAELLPTQYSQQQTSFNPFRFLIQKIREVTEAEKIPVPQSKQ